MASKPITRRKVAAPGKTARRLRRAGLRVSAGALAINTYGAPLPRQVPVRRERPLPEAEVLLDTEHLDDLVAAFLGMAHTKATRQNYAHCWRRFSAFLAPRDPWNAAPRDVARWIAHMSFRGLAYRTISTHLSALNFVFEQLGRVTKLQDVGVGTRPSPAKTPLVRLMMRGLSRSQGKDLKQSHPLSLRDLERMIAGEPNTLRGLRNRAMYVIGWGAALRSSEVLSLDAKKLRGSNGWIEWSSKGLIVHLLRSKSNQAGRRHECYGVPARPSKPRFCPVQLLRQWLAASQINAGPLFRNIGMSQSIKPTRLGFQALYRAMRYRAANVGLAPESISTKSLRAGCITWLFRQGVAPSRILPHSGHASITTMLPYLRMDGDPKSSPLQRTRWAR